MAASPTNSPDAPATPTRPTLRRAVVVGRAAVLPQDQARQARGEHRIARGRTPHRVGQLGRAGGLQQVAGRAGLDRLEHVGGELGRDEVQLQLLAERGGAGPRVAGAAAPGDVALVD